jgi:hypothetical protein
MAGGHTGLGLASPTRVGRAPLRPMQPLELRSPKSPPLSRRQVHVHAVALPGFSIPGPLFMSAYDRDRFGNVGKMQIYPSSFIQFPARCAPALLSPPPSRCRAPAAPRRRLPRPPALTPRAAAPPPRRPAGRKTAPRRRRPWCASG